MCNSAVACTQCTYYACTYKTKAASIMPFILQQVKLKYTQSKTTSMLLCNSYSLHTLIVTGNVDDVADC